MGESDGQFLGQEGACLEEGACGWVAAKLHHLAQTDACLWEGGEVVELLPYLLRY